MRVYTPLHREVAFPLGGIGTGNVSLGARGEFRDWELFNRPGKGNTLPCTFFCLRWRTEGEPPHIRILEGKIPPPYGGPNGWRTGNNEIPTELGGVPRFGHCEMTAAYPFYRLSLGDDAVPLTAELEAFTPFIPLNERDSSIPGAVFTWRVTNRGDRPVEATVAATLLNCVGYDGGEPRLEAVLGNENRAQRRGDVSLLVFDKPGQDPASPLYGTLALAARGDTTMKPLWDRGGWWDGVQDFWDDLLADGRLEAPRTAGEGSRLSSFPLAIGTLGLPAALAPGQSAVFRIALAWYFPHRMAGWWKNADPMPTVRNAYAAHYASAADAAAYLLDHFDRLHDASLRFSEAVWSSAAPEDVREAALRNLSALRSPTVFHVEGAGLMGWEGCLDRVGSCHGTCTHVYNYAQSLAALFPALERSARQREFTAELDEDGAMAFRGQTGFGWPRWDFLPAIDGQFGTVVRLCRQWRRSGDDAWLASLWPGARRALDFGLSHWDPDGDGLPEARQHNTYDIEFYGPNPLGASMMLAALAAGATMARALGDGDARGRWQARYEKGRAAMEGRLNNGAYYFQPLDDPDDPKYQPGAGCLSDQLMGQYMADCAGLPDLLDGEQMKSALGAIARYNFIEDFDAFPALHRSYVLAGEKGLALCTWPRGGKPTRPMTYSDEVWTGVEYEAAALMIRRGLLKEALKIVSAVNERHDGVRRNPFNEAECGHHYARSMASWALLEAWAGYRCDLPSGALYFAPRSQGRHFFSCERAWGVYVWEKGSSRIELGGGELHGIRIEGPGDFEGVFPAPE